MAEKSTFFATRFNENELRLGAWASRPLLPSAVNEAASGSGPAEKGREGGGRDARAPGVGQFGVV